MYLLKRICRFVVSTLTDVVINNCESILPLLQFPKPDLFYFVQVLRRKKDNMDGETITGHNNSARLIKAYYITSPEKLTQIMPEMIALAQVFNARVCINLNPRSFEKAALQTLQKMAEQMANRDFVNVRRAFNSVCGNYHAEIDKRWLIDIDSKAEDELSELRSYLGIDGVTILAEIETKNGWHFITNSFDLRRFTQDFPWDIHKNNPTILYIP